MFHAIYPKLYENCVAFLGLPRLRDELSPSSGYVCPQCGAVGAHRLALCVWEMGTGLRRGALEGLIAARGVMR